jgi:hypothetical protein
MGCLSGGISGQWPHRSPFELGSPAASPASPLLSRRRAHFFLTSEPTFSAAGDPIAISPALQARVKSTPHLHHVELASPESRQLLPHRRPRSFLAGGTTAASLEAHTTSRPL